MITRTTLPIILVQFLTTAALAQLSTAPLQHEHVVHFDKDVAALKTDEADLLLAFLRGLPAVADHTYQVHGHTDSDGSLAYNEDLGRARADQVARHLIQHGADPDRVSITASGERMPVATNRHETGMARNRRVTVTWTGHAYKDIASLHAALGAGSVQRFTIDADHDAHVTGAAGVQVLIPKEMLVDAQGRTVTGPVTVELTEALQLDAMLAHGLNTTSKGRLLETAGMLKLEAFAPDGSPLAIRPGGQVNIAMPTPAPQQGMQLFLSDDGADWTSTDQDLMTVSNWVPILKIDGELPRYPYRQLTPCRTPIYKADVRGRPLMPAPPVLPRMPRAPLRSEFKAHVPWWNFWGRTNARQLEERSYAKAVESYERKLAAVEAKLASYDAEMATYPERMAAYELRKATWNERQAEAYAAWCADVRLPALRRCDRINGMEKERNDSLLNQWTQEYRTALANATVVDSTLVQRTVSRFQLAITAQNFGWINCDRFYDLPASVARPVLASIPNTTAEDAQMRVVVIFTNIRSVTSLFRDGTGAWTSQPLPLSEEATLLAYTVRNGRAWMSVTKVVPGQRNEMELRPSSFLELTQIISELRASSS